MAQWGALATLVVILALVPASALADTLFRGTSGQGRTVKLRTGDDGRVERFAIKWRGDCRRPGNVFVSATQTTPRSPFEVHTRKRFVDVGGWRERLRRGKRAVFRARTVGNRVSRQRWKGIFRVRVRVLRGDRVIDRCHLRTRWRVTSTS